MPPALPPDDRVLTRRREIGDRLRQARLAANLTQEAVALEAGLSRHGLNRVEQGHSAALIDTLIRVTDVIGVPLSDVVRE